MEVRAVAPGGPWVVDAALDPIWITIRGASAEVFMGGIAGGGSGGGNRPRGESLTGAGRCADWSTAGWIYVLAPMPG